MKLRKICTLHKKPSFSITDFFSKCDQIRRKQRIWSHLLKKSLVENFIFRAWKQSHKKRKDSLEGNLDRVLFVTELEFPNALVPRLPKHTSNINPEFAGKSKQLYSFYVTSFLEH